LAVRLPYSLIVGDRGREVVVRAESVNLSKTGMRVRSESQLSPGQTVEVVLMEGTPHPVVARVVWVGQASGTDHYEFGLEYLSREAEPD
jgi:hypothetical protein